MWKLVLTSITALTSVARQLFFLSLSREEDKEYPVTAAAKGLVLFPYTVGAGVTGTCLMLSFGKWEQCEPVKNKGKGKDF